MDPSLLEMLTSINNRLGGIENRLAVMDNRMDGLDSRMALMRNDNARVEQPGNETASAIRQLAKRIPPVWVEPLTTSLLVGATALTITLATR